jgi:hypothetical protein
VAKVLLRVNDDLGRTYSKLGVGFRSELRANGLLEAEPADTKVGR